MTTPRIPLGIQLWSVKNDIAEDTPGTLKKLAAMGFETVETAGLGNYSGKEWKQMLDDAGLTIAGAHVGLPAFATDKIDQTIADYADAGCPVLTVPSLGGEYNKTIDGFKRACSMINMANVKVKEAGMQMGYHNHAFEFKFVENKIPFDVMLQCLTSDIRIHFDMGWVYLAKCDGVQYVKDLPGRVKSIHIKAFKAGDEAALVGEDDVPWTEVCDVCRTIGGTEHFILEHENFDRYSPLETVERCIKNLKAIGL